MSFDFMLNLLVYKIKLFWSEITKDYYFENGAGKTRGRYADPAENWLSHEFSVGSSNQTDQKKPSG